MIYANSLRDGSAINETEKPVKVLHPLIAYGCPPGGTVLDPFAGSCSTAAAARAIGRRSVCIEKRESQCEAAAKRLSQGVLDFGANGLARHPREGEDRAATTDDLTSRALDFGGVA